MEIIETNLKFNTNVSRMATINGIVLHHTGVSTLQSVEVIHNYHKNHNGWAGIGYHFYVRKEGSVYKGRDVAYAGAHCPGVNSTSIGICAEGDFNKETMSEEQKNAIIELIAYLKTKYNITYIKGHREMLNTSCPGANFPLEETRTKKTDLEIKAHIENIGWTDWKQEGDLIGTEGESKRIEAIILKGNNGLDLSYRVHMENIGWSEWVKNGEVAGTTGESRRIEAIEIKSNKLLEVQEHIQNVGWMPSSKGTNIKIGTEGKSLRLEAFKINM